MGIRPFSWGRFGSVPDPDNIDCSGDFVEDVCRWCCQYDVCKKLEEEFEEDDYDINTDADI